MVYVFGAFWLILGLAVFLVAMRSGRRAAPAAADGADAGLESRAGQRWLTIGVVLLIAFGLVIPALVLADNASHKTSVAAGGVHLNAAQRLGRELFSKSCVYCHTLDAVKSDARIGPNLDLRVGDEISGANSQEAFLHRKALVLSAINEGRARGKGDMPALLYQGKEAEDVADFVAAVAGH